MLRETGNLDNEFCPVISFFFALLTGALVARKSYNMIKMKWYFFCSTFDMKMCMIMKRGVCGGNSLCWIYYDSVIVKGTDTGFSSFSKPPMNCSEWVATVFSSSSSYALMLAFNDVILQKMQEFNWNCSPWRGFWRRRMINVSASSHPSFFTITVSCLSRKKNNLKGQNLTLWLLSKVCRIHRKTSIELDLLYTSLFQR